MQAERALESVLDMTNLPLARNPPASTRPAASTNCLAQTTTDYPAWRNRLDPRPWLDPVDANYALAYGFRYEMEVRYRDDAFKVRNRLAHCCCDYVRKVSELRKHYWSWAWDATSTRWGSNRRTRLCKSPDSKRGTAGRWSPGTTRLKNNR